MGWFTIYERAVQTSAEGFLEQTEVVDLPVGRDLGVTILGLPAVNRRAPDSIQKDHVQVLGQGLQPERSNPYESQQLV